MISFKVPKAVKELKVKAPKALKVSTLKLKLKPTKAAKKAAVLKTVFKKFKAK